MKFLMVYPNNSGSARVPLGIMYLLTILKQCGHKAKLFDMTFYGLDVDKNFYRTRAKNLNFRELDLTPYGVTYKRSTQEQVTKEMLAGMVKEKFPQIRTVFGGVFCMTDPEYVHNHPSVDAVCIGEAEKALPELLRNLESGEDKAEIPGFWLKQEDGSVVKNPVAPPTPLDELPFPDLSLIDDRHFFLPMAGHVYKMVHVGSQRGCPRRCTYCCNQLFLDAYKQHLREYLGRKMSIPRLIDNLVYFKEHFGMTFFQLIDDDFLNRPLKDIEIFHSLYKERIDLPFWIQAEANHLTEEKIRFIREAGCIAIAIGIETGNDFVREQVYKRRTSKKATIRAFEIMHKYGIRTSGNVIIGVPHEGRKEVFDTVELVRECQPKALNVNIFAPFRGTALREYCVERGYLKDKDFIRDGRKPWKPVLDMPQITKEEVEGLVRTFGLYVTLPKKYWSDIEKCEKPTEEGDKKFSDLSKLYWSIAEERGIDYAVPGFDYDGFLENRRKELEEP
jgi:radical SAM superfamily enzyme YgiQ (UPF0313 family)